MSNSKIFYILIMITLLQNIGNTLAYTQISTYGNSEADAGGGGGPKIFKAVNFDLIFPKSFNSSENVISTTPETIPAPPTKAAVSLNVDQPYYPLPQSNEPVKTYTEPREDAVAAVREEQQQQPILFITPAPPLSSSLSSSLLATAAEPTNEANNIYNKQQQNRNNYNTQEVTQNAINIEQQRQQQLSGDNKDEKELQYTATGRAVDYHTGYPFGQLITPLIKNAAPPPSSQSRPVYRKPISMYSTSSAAGGKLTAAAAAPPSSSSSNVGKIIYPQAMYQQKPPSRAEIDKLRGKGSFRDRFAPSEGVVSNALKSGHSHDHSHDHHNHAPSYTSGGKTPSASNLVNSFVSPSNLYSFPPNNINYPKPSHGTKVALSSGKVNSYSAPASGPLKNVNYQLATSGSNNSPYQYNGPVANGYLPPSNAGDMDDNKNMDDGKASSDGGGDGDLDNGNGDDTVGVLPASAMDQAGDSGDANGDMGGDTNGDMAGVGDMAGSMDSQDEPDAHSYDTEKEYPTPPPSWLKAHPEAAHDHHHDHDHDADKPDMEPDHSHDHHHASDIEFDHHHHSFPSYPSYPIYDHYPELIYDDHHDHHHHVEPPPPPTTTEAPPPEPPPEPRVKKYSYFYIGRKLWYIPLYFTVWFSFYVLWLILKSIARHKVNLPNHYVARRSVDYDFSKVKQETLNQLTVSVLDKIDKFKRKYLD